LHFRRRSCNIIILEWLLNSTYKVMWFSWTQFLTVHVQSKFHSNFPQVLMLYSSQLIQGNNHIIEIRSFILNISYYYYYSNHMYQGVKLFTKVYSIFSLSLKSSIMTCLGCCHNPNFGLTTKAKAYKGVGQ